MKRRGLPPRRGPIKRKARLKARGAGGAKRRARYDAFMRSPAWRALRIAVLTRAGFRCERFVFTTPPFGVRCPATTTLQAHHLTYARFGGQERLSDLQCLCRTCHRALHAARLLPRSA